MERRSHDPLTCSPARVSNALYAGRVIGILEGRPLHFKASKTLVGAIAVALAAALAFGSLLATRSSADAAYVTAPAVRQGLTQTVTASGTVNPQNTVNVGTQVSGTIQNLYVDYNSKVKKGQVLARLDTSQLQAQLSQAQAALAQAQAQAAAQSQSAAGAQSNIAVAQDTSAAQAANAQASQAAIATADANAAKAQSALTLAQQTIARDKTLLTQGYIAQSQFDTDNSALAGAQAAVQSAQAAAQQARAQAASSENQARASAAQSSVNAAQAASSADTAQAAQAAVAAAQAQVQQDELNVQRAVITSPVDGTVIARDVSVGQTVAASLQTPTLFEIAQNLQKMEVDISVGEPDIGNVRPGERVSFSVLAYPNQTFQGRVSQVRVNPATVNNVVTYTVITLVDNPQNKLLPGMTANATIDTQSVQNALVVPVQALSFSPAARGTHKSAWGQTAQSASGVPSAGSSGTLYVLRGGKPVMVPVHIALVSGTQAAVTAANGGLTEGDRIVLSAGGAKHGTHSAPAASGKTGGPGGMRGLGRGL